MFWLDESYAGRSSVEEFVHEKYGECVIIWSVVGPDDRSPFVDHRYRWKPDAVELDLFCPEHIRDEITAELHLLGTLGGERHLGPISKNRKRYRYDGRVFLPQGGLKGGHRGETPGWLEDSQGSRGPHTCRLL